jgi:hypothetical protein
MAEEIRLPFSKSDIETKVMEIQAVMASGEQIPPEKVQLLKLLQQMISISGNLDASLEKRLHQEIIQDFSSNKSIDIHNRDEAMRFFCNRFITRASESGLTAEKSDFSEVEVPVVGYVPLLDYASIEEEVERVYKRSLWSKRYHLSQDEWESVKTQTIIPKIFGEIDSRKPDTEKEGKEIIRRIADSELSQYVAITEPAKVIVEETKKEGPVVRKSGMYAKIGVGLSALLLAGSIWLITRESGLEEKVSETKIEAVEKPSEIPYVEPAEAGKTVEIEKPAEYTVSVEPETLKIESNKVTDYSPLPNADVKAKTAAETLEELDEMPLPDISTPGVSEKALEKTPVETANVETAKPGILPEAEQPLKIAHTQARDNILTENLVQPQVPGKISVAAEQNSMIIPYVGMKTALHAKKNLGHCPVFGIYVTDADAHKKISACGGIEYSQSRDVVSDPEFNVELESSQVTGKIGMKYNLADEKNLRVSAGLAAKLMYEYNLMNVQKDGTTTTTSCPETLFGAEGAIDLYYNLGNGWNLFVEGALGKNFGSDVNTDLEGAVRIGITKKH